MTVPTILLVNDDGIYAVGLLILKRELEKLGKVVVVAPKDKASGAGKSITVRKPIKIEEVRLSDGSSAYAIDGTPADAAMLGIYKILKHPPDLLLSGINLGYNLNIDDNLSSGTVGAAIEAAIHHVPAIAMSCFVPRLSSAKSEGLVSSQELELAAVIARRTANYVLEKSMPEGVDVISINVPEKADPSRVKITSLSYSKYADIYVKQEDGYTLEWGAEYGSETDPETDLYAVRKERFVSITPITIRFPHRKEKLKGLLRILSSPE